MPRIELFGESDPVLAWDGTAIYGDEAALAGEPPPARLEGSAAAAQPLASGQVRLFRDRLGLGKLFWAKNAGGDLAFASQPLKLVRAGYDLGDIAAAPRGRVITLDADGSLASVSALKPAGPTPAVSASVAQIGAHIREALDAYLAAVATAYPDRRAYLCLSGGLDSSTIAVLARRHFSALTAVSFDIADAGRAPSADRLAAERLCADLGVPMIEANVTTEELISYLDTVLVAGIDWRDFNVHCGLVNAAIADAIAQSSSEGDPPPIVITGDLPNELLVDYQPEVYKGATYYGLPRVDVAKLRSVLVDGLDTCHREVGVFGAFGLSVAQPYAACVDAYLSLPASLLAEQDRKDHLVTNIVGSELPAYIYERPKLRAQIGDTHDKGTLAACIDRGIDGSWLRGRFSALHGVGEERALDRFIRAGRYQTAMPTGTTTTEEDQ